MQIFPASLIIMADAAQALATMREYVGQIIPLIVGLAGVASVLFLMYAGFVYITSRGKPDKLEEAKHILKNALIGVALVLGAATLTAILSGALPTNTHPDSSTLPSLQEIKPNEASNGFVDMVINAVTGLLNNIIQTVAIPFLNALEFFTKATPMMSENPSVLSLWLVVVGMANTLLIIVVALLGMHIMSASTFGLDEIEFKHLLPRVGLIFLLINSSLFIIDGFIRLSNVLILVITQAGSGTSVWKTLTAVIETSGGESVAALLIMMAFLTLSVVLLVYYISRLVTLFIGAVLSPLVLLLWLIPGFRDFSETAIKTYLSTIFVLFIHVVILLLAASLFTGMSAVGGDGAPNVLISMVTGLATILLLLKTQGVMMQFSYVSMGSRNMRKLGGQFINGVSYMTGKTKAGAGVVNSATRNIRNSKTIGSAQSGATRTGRPQTAQYPNKKGASSVTNTALPPRSPSATGINTARKTPKIKVTRVNHPANNSKDISS